MARPISPSVWSPGTFGRLVGELGLTWQALASASGKSVTAIYRWACSNQSGRPVYMRADSRALAAIFDLVNSTDRERGGSGRHTPGDYGFFASDAPESDNGGGHRAHPATTTEALVAAQVRTIAVRLARLRTDAERLAMFAKMGKEAVTAVDRASWSIAWKAFCVKVFDNENAHKTPPAGVEWFVS